MKIQCSKVDPPLGGLIVAEYIKISRKSTLDVTWGENTIVENILCRSSQDFARAVVKLSDPRLYGSTAVEMTEVDHWLTFTLGSAMTNELSNALAIINNTLAPSTFLVGKNISIADFAVFAALYVNKQWQNMVDNKRAPSHILRWYKFMNSQEAVQNVLNSLPADVKANLTDVKRKSKTPSVNAPVTAGNRQQEGKFIDLPGAEIGKVVVRFPPEASGYLHIGHAKAALLNQYYQETFKGKLVMRFDDTNPAKEDVHFEKVILEDVAMLEIKPDRFTHTSEYFDLMIEFCEKLLREGKAYVDDTEAELMKTQREQKIESVNRNNTAEINFSLWEEMKKGTELGQKCCVRAKIDMQSPNGCLRDPTIYRCKNETHPRTGDKYKVYPTYDFACPIVDSIEDVTHVLRTMEYHDRDPQFYWFIEALGLRKPYIWEYSRLSMTNTVLSKRKLTWFVNEGLVDGWDDPRMPTVRGVLRRGMTVQGLKEFIIAQGSSRSVVFMEWDKIWAFNKKVIDPIAPRYTALEYEEPIPVFVHNVKEECTSVPKHPKNVNVGMKDVWVAPRVLIDRVDAECLKEGENATFIHWGNLLIKKINRENGKIISVNAEPNLENKDYKKTFKLTWLAEVVNAPFTPTWCVYFDHIISKPVLGKDEDFKQYIGHETKKEVQMIGDPELRKLKQGDIIQLQRRGFFKVDVPYQPADLHTCKEQPVILFSIPDGHVNENPLGKTVNNGDSKQMYNQKIDHGKQTSNINTLSSVAINDKIIKQGDVVRKLKEQKASKTDIDAAVKILLSLKAEYRNITNTDWKPGCVPCESVSDNAPSRKTDILNAKIAAQGEKIDHGKQASNINTLSSVAINDKIIKQGDVVRKLKEQKASKTDIDAAVKILLSLKAEYRSITNTDWKPGCVPSESVCDNAPSTKTDILSAKIAAQGEKVRQLKAQKSDKAVLDSEVNILLALKADYKSLTGQDWKPDKVCELKGIKADKAPLEQGIGISVDENTLLLKIADQGEKVRELKGRKTDKAAIDNEVKQLLSLKAEFKSVAGIDWKPTMKPAVISSSSEIGIINQTLDENLLLSQIAAQGDKVRMLKDGKADKSIIAQEVNVLLQLKADYKQLTGKEWKPIMKVKQVIPDRNPKKCGDSDMKTKKANKEDNSVKKQTRLGIETKKEENLSDWYSQVITKGEMIEYYDVSGCYIFRPWSFSIWEAIRDWFDAEIKKLGVQNCYFPIFVSKSVLEKEKTHIADFAPEVAWVTKSGDSDMAEPIAVRPTSETVMYPAYAKWIQSYRDLPIKLNQWNNVVRWEFKHPQPFLRTREFLWQEGHTAYALKEEADEEVKQILDLYAHIYTDLLAIPVVKGRKTEKEKFAGGDYTLTVEAFVSASGRAIQGATSHHLGQNFSKMFDITYEDPETQEKKYVYQNSWGITTRTIGVMVMVHADNQGLVLPPRVATIQVVLVPCGITATLSEQARKNLQSSCDELEHQLEIGGIRVKGDYRSNYSPGWKFNHWELKGVPIRVELGPKDVENLQIVAVRRDTGAKIIIPRITALEKLTELLEEIQSTLLKKSTEDLTSHTILLKDWENFSSNLDKKNIILAPFCGDVGCENKIKADSARDDTEPVEHGAPAMGAKSLCIPLEQPARVEDSDRCIHPDCSRKPQFYTLFGRSY